MGWDWAGWDRVGCCRVRYGGMGWAGLGWAGMGRDGLGWCALVLLQLMYLTITVLPLARGTAPARARSLMNVGPVRICICAVGSRETIFRIQRDNLSEFLTESTDATVTRLDLWLPNEHLIYHLYAGRTVA